MAAIDFPSSPVDLQLFAASNGVTYQYRSTPGMWVAVGQSTGRLASFYAAATTSIGTTPVTPTNFAVMTGNEGGYFTPANGRFTPPAGRYRISSGFGSGALASQATNMGTYLRKNGTIIASPTVTTALAGYFGEAYAEYIVDANGTDWFDAQFVSAQGATTAAAQIWFCAIPVGQIVQLPTFTPASTPANFAATSVAGAAVSGSAVAIVFGTVLTGNDGGWYNSSTGVFTPAAGRYLLSFATCANLTAAGHFTSRFFKNGVQIGPTMSQYMGAAGGNAAVSGSLEVDANGTDIFTVVQSASVAGTMQPSMFTAVPVGVLVSMPVVPPTPGILQLYSEQTLTSTGTVMSVAFPPTFKRLELEWFFRNALGDFTPVLQLMQGGTPVASNYNQQLFYGAGASAAAQYLSAQTYWTLGLTTLGKGTLTLHYQSAINFWIGTMHEALVQASNTRVQYNAEMDNAVASVTGIRLTSSTGTVNMDVGSYLRCYAVT